MYDNRKYSNIKISKIKELKAMIIRTVTESSKGPREKAGFIWRLEDN